MNYEASLTLGEPSGGEVLWGSCCRVGDESSRSTSSIPWLRLAIGLFVAAQTMTLAIAINHTPPSEPRVKLTLQVGMLAATLLVLFLLGWPLAREAISQARQRRLTMEALFVVCLSGTFALSCLSLMTGEGPVYFEVVSILLIVYSVGRAVSTHSRARALSTLRELTDRLSVARCVTLVGERDSERTVHVSKLSEGDYVRVLPGELIPVDGRVQQGQAFIRETSFTGEWVPQRRGPGDHVIAGTLCEDGPLLLEVCQASGQRRFDELARLIEQARRSPTSLQRQADRFVAWFLPTVLAVALCTVVFWSWHSGIRTALMHSLAVLLVACPCAAGLATPLVLWSVLGQLAKRGLVVSSGEVIERLAAVDSVIFDKTGTLGDERLSVKAITLPDDPHERRRTLAIIAALECHSHHPVARALRAVGSATDASRFSVTWSRALPGRGVTGEVRDTAHDDTAVPRVHRVTIERDDASTHHSRPVLVATIDEQPVARFAIRERLRESASDAVQQLEGLGLNIKIMTGDGWSGARHVADLAPTSAAMSPEAKYEAVKELRQHEGGHRRPLFVGDGLNDAAAMAASHTSLALASGSHIAMETAAATLHGNDLRLVPESVRTARRAVWAVRTNFLWAVSYNLGGMTLAATGLLNPVLAAVLMAASSTLVSWRSFRVTDALPSEDWPRLDRRASSTARDRRVVSSVTHESRSIGWKKTLHWLGMGGQAMLLIIIARLGAASGLVTLVSFLLITWCALRWWHRMPAWLDMTFAMVTIGGCGMNLGWWADLGFQDALHCPHHCHDTGIISWMNLGMLAVGIPAMFWARFRQVPWSWKRWCCTGMLLLGVPGMVLGMMAGSILSMQLFADSDPSAMVVWHYLFMMLGMCVGMLAPHMLEYLAPVSRG